MRRTMLLMLAVSTLSVRSQGQVPSIKEGSAFLPQSSDIQWHEVVQNQGSSSVEALYAYFQCPLVGPLTRYDSLFNYSSSRSIVPSGSLEITAGDPSKCSGGVKAAIFSDGHVEGSTEALKQLYDRRQGAYAALADSIELLNMIAINKDSTQNVIDTLHSRAQKSSQNHTTKAVGYTTVCIIVSNALGTEHRGLYVPSDRTAHKTPEVEDVMKEKGITRDQALALVLAQKLGEWHSALAGHLEAPSKSE